MTMCIYITTTQSLEIVKVKVILLYKALYKKLLFRKLQLSSFIISLLKFHIKHITNLKIFTSICDGFEREIIKELDAEDSMNVKEKWCVVLKTNY
ncbi:hypothetical protein T4A_4523, partial [Trichinella pseudospiralis]